jgi:hypothetical protein
VKFPTYALDGHGHNLRFSAFSPRMDNANGRQTGSDQDNRKAIGSNDCQGELWTIGDERICGGPSHHTRISSLWQNSNLIAMNLSERDKIIGIKANGMAKAYTVFLHPCTVIAASKA